MGFFDFIRLSTKSPTPCDETPVEEAPHIETANRDVITFLDVETPNRHNDKICSIGIVQTDARGAVLNSFYQLVNPEAQFDDICMSVHGIAPVDVQQSPSFAELWESSLATMLAQSNIVAHNASFDLSVIWKCLASYDLQIPDFRYVCTMSMMKSLHPELDSYKLPAVCDYFNVTMERHHEAMSDASACKDVFWAMVGESNHMPTFESYEYRGRSVYKPAGTGIAYSDETKDMRAMKALGERVIEDGRVSIDEAQAILSLCDVLPGVAYDRVFKPILSIIETAVQDGQVDDSESEEIIKALKRFVDPTSESACAADVAFEGKRFVLSGNFEHGAKSTVEQAIEARGGTMIKSVTKTCDYVVVGGIGNENWTMGNYGAKVKKALDWQAKGINVQILSEAALYNAMEK